MILVSFILGVGNVAVMALAFTKREALAAWCLIAIQFPWTVWDTATHNYGFYLIAGASWAIGLTALWKLSERYRAHHFAPWCWWMKMPHGLMVRVGPWQQRWAFLAHGRFGNGSRWHSGWFRWRDQPEY